MSARGLMDVLDALAKDMDALHFSAPVAHVYNPLVYARSLVEQFVTRYGQGKKRVVLLGMNPGPFGMAQTGVPFGEVNIVRDWLQLTGEVNQPAGMHPKRPVQGLQCTRSEVSGARLWGAVKQTHPQPQSFFAQAFVLNYCPLLFLNDNGANVTPDKLRKDERQHMEQRCDHWMREALQLLQPEVVVGVGLYAKACGERTAPAHARVVSVPHPSPASPQANADWAGLSRSALQQAGLAGLW
jgi:single-strand selective monofunctional uracil DNA glycosylase